MEGKNNYIKAIPIMKNLFHGYEKYNLNEMKPSIINDDMTYMINFMIISDNNKFNKLLNTDKILDVEVKFSNMEDKNLNIVISFNKQFIYECKFEVNNKTERRKIYEAFELSKQIIIWNLDANLELLRVQKINFNFTGYLNIFNKYILQV